MRHRSKKRNSGFSLTEVLIAAGILTIGFMLLLTLFPLGLKLTAKYTEDTLAMLSYSEVQLNASSIAMSALTKQTNIPATGYIDFRELYWDDKDTDNIIDDLESDYIADNGAYELSYDPYLFIYPTVSDMTDEDKKYNSAMIIGFSDGSYADTIIFSCRRLSSLARFPAIIKEDELIKLDENSTNRPSLLSFDIDNNFVNDTEIGDWVRITVPSSVADITDFSLGSYINVESIIIADNDGTQYRVLEVLDPSVDDGEYYIRLDKKLTGQEREAFGKVWFVPPAVGASRSAAVDVMRQRIRIN